MQPSHDVRAIDPLSGWGCGGIVVVVSDVAVVAVVKMLIVAIAYSLVRDRCINISLLKISIPYPTARNLASLMIMVHRTHAVPAVHALVKLAAVDAAGLVHVKHLPVVHGAYVTALGHPERRAHAVPDGVDGINRHCKRAASAGGCVRDGGLSVF